MYVLARCRQGFQLEERLRSRTAERLSLSLLLTCACTSTHRHSIRFATTRCTPVTIGMIHALAGKCQHDLRSCFAADLGC